MHAFRLVVESLSPHEPRLFNSVDLVKLVSLSCPSVLAPTLPQDSQMSIYYLAVGLSICFDLLLGGASHRTVTLAHVCKHSRESLIVTVVASLPSGGSQVGPIIDCPLPQSLLYICTCQSCMPYRFWVKILCVGWCPVDIRLLSN